MGTGLKIGKITVNNRYYELEQKRLLHRKTWCTVEMVYVTLDNLVMCYFNGSSSGSGRFCVLFGLGVGLFV
jgi:hypothetical protein